MFYFQKCISDDKITTIRCGQGQHIEQKVTCINNNKLITSCNLSRHSNYSRENLLNNLHKLFFFRGGRVVLCALCCLLRKIPTWLSTRSFARGFRCFFSFVRSFAFTSVSAPLEGFRKSLLDRRHQPLDHRAEFQLEMSLKLNQSPASLPLLLMAWFFWGKKVAPSKTIFVGTGESQEHVCRSYRVVYNHQHRPICTTSDNIASLILLSQTSIKRRSG